MSRTREIIRAVVQEIGKRDARVYEKALKALDEAKDWYVFDPSKDKPVKFREPTKYRGVNDTKEDEA